MPRNPLLLASSALCVSADSLLRSRSMPDGRVFTENQDRTCNNWTIQEAFFNQGWIGASRSLMEFKRAALLEFGPRRVAAASRVGPPPAAPGCSAVCRELTC